MADLAHTPRGRGLPVVGSSIGAFRDARSCGAHTRTATQISGRMIQVLRAQFLAGRWFTASPGQQVFIGSVLIPEPRGDRPLLVS